MFVWAVTRGRSSFRCRYEEDIQTDITDVRVEGDGEGSVTQKLPDGLGEEQDVGYYETSVISKPNMILYAYVYGLGDCV